MLKMANNYGLINRTIISLSETIDAKEHYLIGFQKRNIDRNAEIKGIFLLIIIFDVSHYNERVMDARIFYMDH